MIAYYNEIDPKAAATLRKLIKVGLIAPGEVDERSIVDVRPSDLKRFAQCHFFAGGGVWSYALRLADWDDYRPVWTGSCPCQPFSAAGKGAGFHDERHLWPAWFHLIENAKPRDVPVFGEQVASNDGLSWLDLVQADLEGADHAVRAFDLCAAGFGAPHARQRLYFVADSAGKRHDRRRPSEEGLESRSQQRLKRFRDARGVAITNDAEWRPDSTRWDDGIRQETRRQQSASNFAECSEHGGLADVQREGLERHGRNGNAGSEPGRVRPRSDGSAAEEGPTGLMGNTEGRGCGERRHEALAGKSRHSDGAGCASGELADSQLQSGCAEHGSESGRWLQRTHNSAKFGCDGEECRPGPVNGHWRDADWLLCRDGKWRPVEPGTFPLVNGTSERVGRLRLYGNAIVSQVAAAFIKAYDGVAP